jgi:hypothetical protein
MISFSDSSVDMNSYLVTYLVILLKCELFISYNVAENQVKYTYIS